MKNNKKYIIIILSIVLVGLIIFCFIYAIKNKNAEDIKKIDNMKYTMQPNQLDSIKLPEVKVEVNSKTLPNTTSTLTDIDVSTLEKLFKTSEKSIVLLVKNDCSYCQEFEPRVKELLEKLKINAYRINISNYSDSDMAKLFDYLNFEGTPTTFVIENGKVNHTLSGVVDNDTFVAFIDYFYFRSN